MRLINKILRYKFTEEEKQSLIRAGIVNGCGGKGGFKFSLLKDKLKKVDFFDPDKIESLYNSIETKACTPHDLDFEKGGGLKEFLKANYKFTITVLRILDWTSFKSRFIIGVILLLGLNTIGIKYFNWK